MIFKKLEIITLEPDFLYVKFIKQVNRYIEFNKEIMIYVQAYRS
jgi:hypothetical protein